jgi:tRNA pseudouridine38-40 synthase
VVDTVKVNVKLEVQYDGTDFNGWQIQEGQTGSRTVQSELKQAVEKIVKEPVVLIGAGRTDAGVHARGQVANFITAKPIPEEKWVPALNSLLDGDIRVTAAEEVPLEFHAQHSALKKMYCYYILNSRYADVFLRRYTLHCTHPLDIEGMSAAVESLKGRKDFRAFCASGSSVKSFERTIYQADIFSRGKLLVFRITADGFLYKMVRTVVGTLLEIGKGKQPPEWMESLIEGGERIKAGPTAPPQGLVLEKVWYVE